jgi:hypothetical protein
MELREFWHKFKTVFPEQLMRKVVEAHDSIFDCALLKTNYNKLQLSFMAQKTFKWKSAYEILQWFHSNQGNLQTSYFSIHHPSYNGFGRTKLLSPRKNQGLERLSHVSLLLESLSWRSLKKKLNWSCLTYMIRSMKSSRQWIGEKSSISSNQ